MQGAGEYSGPRYKPHIDGLRAIAVLGVLLFHFGGPVFGGFVGVDVFYVISGFLITASIVDDLSRREFSLAAFYERRLRRIFPAYAVVTLGVAVASAALLLPTELVAFEKSLCAAATFTTNFYFYSTADYFSPSATTMPLLHYWSLAIEEQFYLIFPIVVMLLARLGRGAIWIAIACGFVVSLVSSEIVVHRDPSAAFYLLPFRAFELLSGSLVALFVGSVPASRWPSIAGHAATGGLVLVCASMLVLSENSSFPGLLALPPCAGTALVILGGEYASGPKRIALRLLCNPALVGIGKVSYSLYLVHWPIVVFAKALSLTAEGTAFAISATVLSLGLATLLYLLVEQPVRGRSSPVRTTVLLGSAVGITFAFVATANLVIREDGFRAQLDARVRKVLAYQVYDIPSAFREGTCFLRPEQTFADFQEEHCLPKTGRRVVFWGSSILAQFASAMPQLLDVHGILFGQITASGCVARLGIGVPARPNCRAFNDNALAAVLKNHPDLVVIEATLLPGTAETIAALTQAGLSVALLGPMPLYNEAVPAILARRLTNRPFSDLSDEGVLPATIFEHDQVLADHFAGQPLTIYLSVLGPACPGHRCPLADHDVPLHFDPRHVTRQGATYFGAAILPALLRALPATRTSAED